MNLPLKFVEELVRLPETGMGYQKVRFKLIDSREFTGVVFNCQKVGRIDGHKDIPFQSDQIDTIEMIEPDPFATK